MRSHMSVEYMDDDGIFRLKTIAKTQVVSIFCRLLRDPIKELENPDNKSPGEEQVVMTTADGEHHVVRPDFECDPHDYYRYLVNEWVSEE